MKLNKIKRNLFYIGAVGVSICLLFFFVLGTWIGYEVKVQCQEAAREYEGGCVEALMAQVDDDEASYRDRNRAIWALGQLGDGRALSVLEKYYTGEIPEREPVDKMISQYELKKAINLAGGGVNIGAWVWRGMVEGE